MKNRLICIWSADKTLSANSTLLTLEVCLNVGKKTFSPFKRNISVYELKRDFRGEHDFLLNALAGTGQVKQPFIFTRAQLEIAELQQAIKKLPYHFSKKGSSIHPLNNIEAYLPAISSRQISHIPDLISAELIIPDVKIWWEGIKVSFRYNNMLHLIPATNRTCVPFVDDDGNISYRDYEKESTYLSNLPGELDYEFSLLLFDGADTEALKQSMNAGWKVLVRQNHKHLRALKIISNPYGIDWFTSSSDDRLIPTELADKLLDSFLKSQNYYESKDGEVTLFNKQQFGEIPKDVIAETMHSPANIKNIYSPIRSLSSSEQKALRQKISHSVRGTLMDFQFEGVVWLTEMRRHNTGCLLADDMGLGKTLQTITYLSTMSVECKFLIVAPTSLIDNWNQEILRFTPQLRPQITIVSFDQLRQNINNYEHTPYDTMIIDEGQIVKNANTQRHHAISKIKSVHTIMLSGTPIENGVHEIWSQFKILIPGIETMQKRILKTCVSAESHQYVELTRALLSPFILRRTKVDVLKSFPNKRINNIFIELSKDERITYNRIKKIVLHALETGVTGRVNSIALTGLLRLRQACVCPAILPQQMQYTSSKLSSKFTEALKILFQALAGEHKILIFSQFTSVLEKFQTELNIRQIPSYTLTGDTVNRANLVNAFNASNRVRIFLISLKAGGIGLNLASADRIILLDDWWNPAVEEQAFARAHRIGQTQNVEVYRLICKETIEEKILELQDKKREVSDIFNSRIETITIDHIKELLQY